MPFQARTSISTSKDTKRCDVQFKTRKNRPFFFTFKAKEIPEIKIFRYSGGLSFASRAAFRELLNRKMGFDPQSVLRRRAKLEESSFANSSTSDSFDELMTKCIVLDFAALTFVDPAGVELLRQLQADYAKLGVVLFIASCSGQSPSKHKFDPGTVLLRSPLYFVLILFFFFAGPVYERFVICDREQKIESKFMIFATIHDAVLFAHTNVIRTKST